MTYKQIKYMYIPK